MRDENQIKSKSMKGINKKLRFTVLLLACSGVSIFVGNRLTANGVLPMTTDSKLNNSFKNVKDIDQYQDLFSIRDQIYKYYDGEIDEEKLVNGAIKGMTMGLEDPYTYYMTEKEFNDFMEKNSGEYMGVGLQVANKDGEMVVIEPIEGGPSYNAGILAGDIIRAVNDVPMTGNDLDKAVSMMKGKEKADIKITLERAEKGVFDVSVTRDVVKTINIKGEMVSDSVGYISIKAFEEHVGEDFIKKIEELEGQGMKGLILDLRENPGGYMTECVTVASQFIEKGKTIVSTTDKYGESEKNLSKGGIAQGMPLVVLVNGNSASASEVVAGAIRDYDAGTIVGTTSFGKGIVQVPIKQKDGSALKITISKYYTPSGENIHKIGIKPDVEVEYPKELRIQKYDRINDPQFNKALEVINGQIN